MKQNQTKKWSKTFWSPFVIALVISIALSPSRSMPFCAGSTCVVQHTLLFPVILYACTYMITSYIFMCKTQYGRGRVFIGLLLGAIFPDILINIFQPLSTLGAWPDLLARVGGVALGCFIYYLIVNRSKAK